MVNHVLRYPGETWAPHDSRSKQYHFFEREMLLALLHLALCYRVFCDARVLRTGPLVGYRNAIADHAHAVPADWQDRQGDGAYPGHQGSLPGSLEPGPRKSDFPNPATAKRNTRRFGRRKQLKRGPAASPKPEVRSNLTGAKPSRSWARNWLAAKFSSRSVDQPRTMLPPDRRHRRFLWGLTPPQIGGSSGWPDGMHHS